MNKEAGLNTIFAGMEAVDGVKKMKDTYQNKSVTNKYDNLMGTSIVKAPKVMGAQNAIIGGKNKMAAQELDEIYKQAKLDVAGTAKKVGQKLSKVDIGGTAKKMSEAVSNFDTKNTQHIKDTISHAKNKKVMETIRSGLKAVPGTALGAGLIAGAGVGTAKGLKKLDKRDNPQSNAEYNAMGAALSGALAAKALSSGRMLKPITTGLGIAGKSLTKIPGQQIKKTPGGAALAGGLHQAAKDSVAIQKSKEMAQKGVSYAGSQIEQLMGKNQGLNSAQAAKLFKDQQMKKVLSDNWGKPKEVIDEITKARGVELDDFISKAMDIMSKKASTEIDCMYKIAGAKTDYLGDVVKKKFFKSGLESLPYYAGTAALGYMVDRGVNKKIEDDKLIKARDAYMKKKQIAEIPENTEKVANAADAVFFKNPKINAVFKQSLESAVEGVGRSVMPTVATAITGRNIANSFRKLDRTNEEGNSAPDEQSIHLSRKDRRDIRKMIGSEDMGKTAEDMSGSQIIEEIMRNTETDVVGATEKLDGDKVHVGNGVKKTFRMLPSHGMQGMHGNVE